MTGKGRPVSRMGRDAGGLHDGGPAPAGSPVASGDLPDDRFDPFESFEVPGASGVSGAPEASETIYSRSRRTPGDRSSSQAGSSSHSRHPVRSLKGRALGYLSRREYSRAELARKLAPFAEEADSLEALLNALEQEGWLSDTRFAESVIHRRASRMGMGRIVGELRQHGVGQTLIEEAGARLRETELARAQAVWRKKYGQIPATPTERARQARFLAARVFPVRLSARSSRASTTNRVAINRAATGGRASSVASLKAPGDCQPRRRLCRIRSRGTALPASGLAPGYLD